MKPEEFKAWFEGFTESIGGPPNEQQWARIKEQVGRLAAQTASPNRYLSTQQGFQNSPQLQGIQNGQG